MKKIIILSTLISVSFLYSDTRILFYLNPAPAQINEWVKNNTESQLVESQLIESRLLKKENAKIEKINKIDKKTPGEVSQKLLKNEYKKYLSPKLGGFLALYGGYVDYSNIDGQVSFPLRHDQSKMYLVITPKIELIKVKGNTISHKEFDPEEKKNTQVYLFEKKEDKDKKFYWQVSKQETSEETFNVTEEKIINPLSVVLLTKPKNIFVATGDFMSNDNKQLVLPTNIYVLSNNQNSKILLNFMNIKNYFEPIEIEDKKVSDVLFEKIITNN